jgi:hypothetical protein
MACAADGGVVTPGLLERALSGKQVDHLPRYGSGWPQGVQTVGLGWACAKSALSKSLDSQADVRGACCAGARWPYGLLRLSLIQSEAAKRNPETTKVK